jgi:hypothetical protein
VDLSHLPKPAKLRFERRIVWWQTICYQISVSPSQEMTPSGNLPLVNHMQARSASLRRISMTKVSVLILLLTASAAFAGAIGAAPEIDPSTGVTALALLSGGLLLLRSRRKS